MNKWTQTTSSTITTSTHQRSKPPPTKAKTLHQRPLKQPTPTSTPQ